MKTTKILFTDLDGTLLNDEKNISYENKQAINKALDQDHKVVITTGRPLPSVLLLLQDLGLTSDGCYAITYNGGLIYDCGKEKAIFKTKLPLDYMQHIFEMAKEHGIHYHTYSAQNVIADKVTNELEKYCNSIKIPYQIVDNICTSNLIDPVKAILVDFEGKERLSKIKKELEPWCIDKVNCYFSSPQLLEFGSLEATKGKALAFLSNYLNVPIENTIAAGDEENDISMIRAAGVGAVMANASEEIKKYGNYITTHNNNNHGIAEIIEHFMLS